MIQVGDFSSKQSVAVLPFANQSGDPEQEYLSDGISEEILNALAQIEGLKVTSRTSSFHFKGQNISLPEIADALQVDTILEGSVRQAGERIRITARLIDVAEDVQFWSESFDRSNADLFAVQDEISLLIADRLREQLGHFELEDQLMTRPNASPSSYQEYLRARYFILKMGKSDLETGLRILEQVLERDPDFAHAHIGIHHAYTMLGALGFVAPADAFTKGQSHLERAIELQPDLPECQINQSWNAFVQHWDFAAAYEHLQRSAAIRPTTDYFQSMASTLVAEGRFTAAHHYIDSGLEVDPFSHIGYHLKGFIYYSEEKYQDALAYFNRSLELNPASIVSPPYKGQSLLALNRPEESLQYFQSLRDDEPGEMVKLGGITMSLAVLGQEAEVRTNLKALHERASSDQMGRAAQILIITYTLLEDIEEALNWLTDGIKRRLPLLIYLFTEPLLAPLQKDRRFQQLKAELLGTPIKIEAPTRKYKQTLLEAGEIEQYRRQLEQLMQDQLPHLDPKLTLRDLAEQMGMPANQLSQLLNMGFQQNFAEFVNSYRLQTFKEKVANPKLHHLTLLALAYDSGFNSKTVFNTFFKKKMGMTPRTYWKQVIKG
ncbi:MAG: helix-turn-helix domain-containing protein [Bacteroidota bacterium]